MSLIRSSLKESRHLITLCWPIMIAQMAQHAMGFVDTLMASHAGPAELAAIALGSSIWLPLMLTLCGVLIATTPLVAHRVGAGRESESASILSQALGLALLLSVLAVILLNNTDPLLALFRVDPLLASKTATYLSAISWGFPPMLLYQALRSFSEGFGRTRPIMRIAIIGMLANIPLNYMLIFGKAGLPALGGVGCGYATSAVMWGMLSLGIVHLIKDPTFREARSAFRWSLPHLDALGQFLRLGLPIGIALLIEASMFSVIALFLAGYGDTVISAHQITFSVTGLMFMIPLSVAMALTIRTGQLLGRAQFDQARFSAGCGIALTIVIAFINSSILLIASREIASAYTDIDAIIDMTVQLMWIAALFQIADSIQVSAGGALRGYKDTSATLAVVFVAYWLVGLPAGYVMAEPLALGVFGYWWGLLAGLTIGAVLLSIRLYRISHALSPAHSPLAGTADHSV